MNFSLRTQIIAFNAAIIVFLLLALGFALQFFARRALLYQIDQELVNRLPPLSARFQSGPPPDGDFGHFRPDRHSEDIPGFGYGPERGPDHHRPPDDGPPFGKFGGPGGPGFPGPRPPGEMFRAAERPRRFKADGSPLYFPNDSPFDADAVKKAAKGNIQERIFTDLPPVPRKGPSDYGVPPLRVLTVRRATDIIDQTAFPSNEVDRAMDGLKAALLGLLPIGLLAAAIGSAVLTDRVLRPVRAAARAADALGAEAIAGEDAARLPVAGKDEFSELAATFNALLDRLAAAFQKQERVLEQQKRFTADASHELKTPLTAIRGNATYALSLPDDNPNASIRRKEALTDIAAAAEDMNALVQNLLLLARADAGTLGREQSVTPLSEIIVRALNRVGVVSGQWSVVGKEYHLTLNIRNSKLSATDHRPLTTDHWNDGGTRQAPRLLGSPDELTRLFANLLANALRHTPTDGEIMVSAAEEEGFVRIIVADTGEGIAPEHLPHLGERFYRADAARARAEGETSGTGLGLSICRAIAEAHGGTLTIESELGIGTTVTVTLPCG